MKEGRKDEGRKKLGQTARREREGLGGAKREERGLKMKAKRFLTLSSEKIEILWGGVEGGGRIGREGNQRHDRLKRGRGEREGRKEKKGGAGWLILQERGGPTEGGGVETCK